MTLQMLKGKIHRAVVVQAELDYVGSITIDPVLMEEAGILEYEKVEIVDVENGSRFETYTICGEPNSGMICLNGAAARMVQVNDHIIIMCYAQMTPEEAKFHKPRVVFVDDYNQIVRVSNYEKHGQLSKDMSAPADGNFSAQSDSEEKEEAWGYGQSNQPQVTKEELQWKITQ